MIDNSPDISLRRLNAVRILIVLFIALGYASTMPLGPGNSEIFAHLGYDPSWIGIHLLFFFSGFLALRSLRRHGSAVIYLKSRAVRNMPLLIVFTLLVVTMIYPLLGVIPEDPVELVAKLGSYFFLTVTCIDPGQTLPGLLDQANYMCIIQGAVWTFKWGMIAHVAVAIVAKLNLFKHDRLILAAAILVAVSHFIISYIQAKSGYDWLITSALGLRLAYPFVIGMACYAYFHKLPKAPKVKALILASLIGGATLWHEFLLWTPVIEMLVTLFWAYGGLLLATSKTSVLNSLDAWPNLALGMYLANWPTAQLLLLAYPDISSWGLVALTLPVTALVAIIAHMLVSRPAYNFARLQIKPA